ncbi:MAG: hypothetical protein K0Q73_3904 [Paenibacillus sp.]|nr:hypothetical protein [Paenibacillus sp.]
METVTKSSRNDSMFYADHDKPYRFWRNPDTTIATGITGTSYTDTGLTADTAFYYVVCSVNPNTEQAPSTWTANKQGKTLP